MEEGTDRMTEDGADNIWSTAVQKTPPQLLKFFLNAVQDIYSAPQCQLSYVEKEGRPLQCL